MSSSYRYVILEKKPELHIAKIILNRPEKMNAMNQASQFELLEALEACTNDIRVVVITGAGERSFCTGIDVKELSEVQNKSEGSADGDSWIKVCLAVRSHPSIFISAVNGFALGGGVTLVNVSDLAVAADHATFGMPEVSFGSFPRLAGPSTARRIAPKNVSWMALTGERIDADTAMSWGLINKVVPGHALDSVAESLALNIAKQDPIALTWTKRGLAAVETLDTERSLQFGSYVRAMISKERLSQ